MPKGRTYKVKLLSGRILGPLDLNRIRLLILKNQIKGKEWVCLYPERDWKDINQVPEIAELLISSALGELKEESTLPHSGKTRASIEVDFNAPTQVLPQEPTKLQKPTQANLGKLQQKNTRTPTPPLKREQDPEPEDFPLEKEELTEQIQLPVPESDEDRTRILDPKTLRSKSLPEPTPARPSEEATVLIHRERLEDPEQKELKKEKLTPWKIFRTAMVGIAILAAAHDLFGPSPETDDLPRRQKIKVAMPIVPSEQNPLESRKFYEKGIKAYLLDNLVGYRIASENFFKAASYDSNNAQALSMLVSSYLHLIDVSNQDENYFTVITRLLKLTRAKNLDLPETVIADYEFYRVTHRLEAAKNRIVDYTKTHKNFGVEFFYYIAQAFYLQGDVANASQFLNQIPENVINTPAIYFLKGQIAELSSPELALAEYEKAIQKSTFHVKSRLRRSEIFASTSRLTEAAADLKYLVTYPELLAPKNLARAYYLHFQLLMLENKRDEALVDLQRAVSLDSDNHDYLLELYSIRASIGEKDPQLKEVAKMYYFLSEAEKLRKEAKYQEALNQYLLAREANLSSALPLIKAGDMFLKLHDYANARLNFELATKKAAKSTGVWSRYASLLIESYDWDEAEKAIEQLKRLKPGQSRIDKLRGDLFFKQGRHDLALAFYRKAMKRDTVDPHVYIAYAETLSELGDCENALFFFALARRFDPVNAESVAGSARCMAQTTSIGAAIEFLQEEISRESFSTAVLLSVVAELHLQQGEENLAQQALNQAMSLDPESATPYKVQAKVHLENQHRDPSALTRALRSFKAYSDRNQSDPTGYLERYRIFMRLTQFEKAAAELEKVYGLYPRYPNLHYFKGALYSLMKNHGLAIEEFEAEIRNNPRSANSYLALGKEWLEAGDALKALNALTEAMKLAPQASEPKHWAGYANHRLQNFSGAIALYQSALAIDPANAKVYRRLGESYLAVQDQNQARTAFQKYLEMEPDAPDRAEILRVMQ